MKTPTLALLCFFLLGGAAFADEQGLSKAPSGSIILDFKVSARLGSHKMESRPKVAVADGKEAEISMVDDEDGSRLVIKVKPTKVAGDPVQIKLEIEILAESGDKKIHRKMKYATLPGHPYKMGDEDKKDDTELYLEVTASITP